MTLTKSYPISIAPMMGYTDRHFRYLLRLLHPEMVLYTEMLTSNQVIHGNKERLLGYSEVEHPLVIQLAGCNPKELSRAGVIVAEYGYKEINLNIGCPSQRIAAASYGACLFKQPDLVADCVAAMRQATHLEISVKTRVAVDDYDEYKHLHDFISTVASAGCDTFIIHARKAWLQGLNPKQNRQIPTLQPELVYQVKKDFPKLHIVINGGINNLELAQSHLQQVDGIMLGRVSYKNIRVIAEMLKVVDNKILGYGPDRTKKINNIEELYSQYIQNNQQKYSLRLLVKPLCGLYHAIPGAQAKRRLLQEMMQCSDSRKLQHLCVKLASATM